MPTDDNMGFQENGTKWFDGFTEQEKRDYYVDYGVKLKQNVNSQLLLTVGKWKFTIGKPIGPLNNFTPISKQVAFLDDNNDFQMKAYTVEAVSYNPISNKLEVTVDIHENPIPLFIIYGAVIGIASIVAAMSIDSVLEKVEQVITSVPKELGKSPFAWAIVLIFLIPVVMLVFRRKKA